MMKYVLTKDELSCTVEVELAKSQFEKIKEYKAKFIVALEVEEKYDIVIENYKELECELLRLGVDNMLFSDRDWHGSMKNRRLIGRRISNLLSSVRLYIDHTKHHISAIYGKSSDKYKATERFFSEQYDSYFGYRLMEALRNHVQHAGIPFSYSVIGRRLDGDRDQMANTVSPSLMIKEIVGNKDFKATVRKELDLEADSLDIKPLIREYIESVSNVNHAIREMVASDIRCWQSTLTASIDMFREEYYKHEPDKNITTLCAARINGNEPPEMIQLFSDLVEHRADLLQKNRHLANLSKRFVTGQVEKYLN